MLNQLNPSAQETLGIKLKTFLGSEQSKIANQLREKEGK